MKKARASGLFFGIYILNSLVSFLTRHSGAGRNPCDSDFVTALWVPAFAGTTERESKGDACKSLCLNIRKTQAETGILPILACQIFGAVLCTDSPFTSTATDTGMSSTTNS